MGKTFEKYLKTKEGNSDKKENIVKNMHEAYEKIDLTSNNFGIFISGPSKTADIEQSLVLGAHVAIEHLVFWFD